MAPRPTRHGACGASLAPDLLPLVTGKPPGDYYWCANCKAYHLRETDQPVHPEGK